MPSSNDPSALPAAPDPAPADSLDVIANLAASQDAASDMPASPPPAQAALDTLDALEGAAQAPATDDQGDATAPAKAAQLSPAACADLLKQHFPALFTGQPKPLKLRIQADIQERAPGVFSKPALSAFFRRYTGSTSYLIALGKAAQRFDLDGQAAGELSEEHRQLARDELTRRRQVVREREQQAQAQQQAAQAEVMAARQARASLLRDFQRTTLTLANFCALKGMPADELNPVLELARQEAAEAPPPRPHDDRRGPGPRADQRPPGSRDDQRPAGPRGDRPGPRDGDRPAGAREGRRDVSGREGGREGGGARPPQRNTGGRPSGGSR